ncbi:MAG: ShlB/FhaC/HecB family hemolysin secretion/activation protein, partial [Ferruginibacter sp.]
MIYRSLLAFGCFSMILLSVPAAAQQKDSAHYKTLPASSNYIKSDGYQRRWGTHYRTEWQTPVTFPIAILDTLAGGLTPYQAGGGRQSKSLRLHDKNNREYVLRSIDKSFGKALPDIAQGTFIEDIANDQVTIAHPYAAVTIAPMAEAAGIYHTNPVILYIPKQLALGNFSDEMGNNLYLFEQRPDENWETAANFGNSKNIVGTEKMLEKTREDNDDRVDQEAFVRARIFDLFIGDWGRHEDQWRWSTFKDGKKTTYVPVPRDRDQAYTVFDGSMLQRAIKISGLKHLQTFDSVLKDPIRFNFPARNLDAHITNEVPVATWKSIAEDLQKRLTDNVIDNAMRQLPPEVYNFSGPSIATDLKNRRIHLAEYAEAYANYLAEETDITGSEDDDQFEVIRLNNQETEINIYKITNDGDIKKKPFYHRVFNIANTKEIRLYGLKGNDVYNINGPATDGIKVRIIGGTEKDSYTNTSQTKKKELQVYDSGTENIFAGNAVKKHLSKYPSINHYDYQQNRYDKSKIGPIAFYSFEDRFYVGLAYNKITHGWRKNPYAQRHYLDVKYSISQKAFSTTYKGIFTSALGRWDFKPVLNYDFIRWRNYYGIGNGTILEDVNADYNRMRFRTFQGELGLEQVFQTKHRVSFIPFFQSVDIIADTARYIAKGPTSYQTGLYMNKNFTGAHLEYVYQALNDSILPTKGVSLKLFSAFTYNLYRKDNFTNFGTEANAYLPLGKTFSLAVKAGAATLTGSPEFYQYNRIGGTNTLRGYQRDRFYGNTAVFNQNELRWITDFRTHLVNGKIGLFALYDIGRVWVPNDNSNTWHPGYGGGLILSFFNRITGSVAYAVSPEDASIHLDLI